MFRRQLFMRVSLFILMHCVVNSLAPFLVHADFHHFRSIIILIFMDPDLKYR